ncbi:unnamed protein product [Enterobius vermicularis]|uniref:7TM_GPCR_Srx domain-containing protein n=1 Tax=Enterobius vermicularis TaxID=51028 RepID=A0A0N4UXA5_ENTVE|nr:unnamed protein product [Enterobius vermicularis]
MLLSMPHTLGYFSKITFNCLIAIERISMFLCKSFHHFVETHTLLYISIGWFVGVLTIISTTVIGCWKTYSTHTMQFTYSCGTCTLFGDFEITAILLWGTQALQGSVTCFSQFIDSFMFYTFPMIAPSAVWAAALANFIYVGNALAQAPILLVFNKSIRSTLADMCGYGVSKVHSMKPTTIEGTKF